MQVCHDVPEECGLLIEFPAGEFLEVTTNKERLDDLEGRLETIERALPGIVLPERNKWRPIGAARDIVRRHKGWSIAVATLIVAVATLGYMVYSDHEKAETENFNLRVDLRIDTRVSKQLSDLDIKVTKIQTSLDDLKPYIESLVRRDFEKVAGLSRGEFNDRLPEVQHLVSVARNQDIRVSPALVDRVSKKLLGVQPRTPEFWAVSANLLSYKSLNDQTRKLLTAELPNCTDSQPVPMRIVEVPNPNTAKFSRGIYENCRFTLDSEQDNQRLNATLSNQVPLITFKHCLIVYRGGPVNLIIAWKNRQSELRIEGEDKTRPLSLSGNALEFENCLFVFSVQGEPPPKGQEITETLLAQNGNTLKLPSP